MARSYLFIPGNVPRMLQNADVFEADALIIDLEDAISAYEKDEARGLAAGYLESHRPEGMEVYVRINNEPPLFAADLEALKTLPLDGFVLPKATLGAMERFRHFFADEPPFAVLALIETPRAFYELDAIAGDVFVAGLVLGGVDLRTAIQAETTLAGEEILHARSRIVLAARAEGIRAIDTPWAKIADESLRFDAKKARSFGFDGKCAIHPDQIQPINEIFTPSQGAIKEARRIVKRHEEEGGMRFTLDGRMVDRPVIENAKRLLEKARRYGVMETEEDE